jgi:hypothetical protein
MNTHSPSANPWRFLPLPENELHSLKFLRPDVLLHVHDLWAAGKHNEPTERMFVRPDVTDFEPFHVMGVSACMDYIKHWHITKDDIALLSGIGSLSSLSPEFWNYLLSITHFSGSVSALPEGQMMSPKVVSVSDELRKKHGDEKIPLNVLFIEGKTAEVALISEAFGTILDFAIAYSTTLVRDKLSQQPPTYYDTERTIHPYWARLAAWIEYIIVGGNPKEIAVDKIWLWADEVLDGDIHRRVGERSKKLELAGHQVAHLIRSGVE